jgi:pyrroloquinoline quinone biosynthesis protein D
MGAMTVPDRVSLARVPAFPRGVRLKHDEARQEWVLLAPERLIKCDAVAAAILALCDGKRSLGEIIETLASHYKADQAVIARDVVALLEGLQEKKMVRM